MRIGPSERRSLPVCARAGAASNGDRQLYRHYVVIAERHVRLRDERHCGTLEAEE
jgi:hypothetical protein